MENLSDEQYDAIAAYISKQMTALQRVAFEAELDRNPALNQEVEHQRTIQRGMQLLAYKREAADMLKRISVEEEVEVAAQQIITPDPKAGQPIRQVVPQPKPVPVRPLWARPMAWAAAASVVLLMGLFWFLLKQPTLPDSNTPVAGTDKPTPPLDVGTTTDSTLSDTTTRLPSSPPPTDRPNPDRLLADAFFRASPKPAPVFDPGPDVDAAAPDDSATVAGDSASVLRGVTLLKRRRDRDATVVLQRTVLEGYPGHWRATAEWYLSLAYLRTNKPGEARKILSRIARTKGHPYEAEARRLKREMQ